MPVGVLFASTWLFATLLGRTQSNATRPSWQRFVLIAFEVAIVIPLATVMLRFYPQWSTSYTLDPQIFPGFQDNLPLLSAAQATLLPLLAAIGFSVGQKTSTPSASAVWLYWLTTALGLGAVVVGLVFAGDRGLRVTDYDSYWQGQGAWLFHSWVGLATLLWIGGHVALWVWIQRPRLETPRLNPVGVGLALTVTAASTYAWLSLRLRRSSGPSVS